MSDGLKVNPDSLTGLASQINAVVSNMSNLQGNRDGLGNALEANWMDCDGFPTQAFKDAGSRLSQFAGDWSNGIDKIKGNADTLATALKQAATAYCETDDSLGSGLTCQGSGS